MDQRRNIWGQIAYSPICFMKHIGDLATGLFASGKHR